MLNGLYLSAMGAKVQDARVDVAANNLANLNTTAFRRDQAVFRFRPAEQAMAGAPDALFQAVGGGVFLQKVASSDEEGALKETGHDLDLALQGPGFFKVRDAQGNAFYTRAGNFRRDDAGFLVTGDGRYRVQGLGGGGLEVPEGQIDINEAGEVYSGGTQVGQVGVVMPPQADRLRKRGDNLWVSAVDAEDGPSTAQVRQGFLEESSVDGPREMTEMIQAQRMYEFSLKALRIQDELLGRTVTDVGRATA